MINLEIRDFHQFKKYITEVNNYLSGGQIVFNFPNGYGASLINHAGSYGNEIAVLKNNDLCYDTEITGDVLGHLKQHEIIEVLHKIKNLKCSEQIG